MKRVAFAAAALALATSFLPGRGSTQPSDGEERFRVGLVFDVGGRGDKSFNDAAWAGLERARSD